MLNKKSAITFTIINKFASANYGESLGNAAALKKMVCEDGKAHTYLSRQALRYNIYNQMGEAMTPIESMGSGDKKVLQFAPSATIEEYPEIDLFGYLKTVKNQTVQPHRSAVVRLSNAVSLTPYEYDMDFLTNMGLAERIRKENSDEKNNIAQAEVHQAYYAYTVAIDLDRVGVDENVGIDIDNTEKARRVQKLLDTIQYLYRDIKGRREDLKPLFIIGGNYEIKNPLFETTVKVEDNKVKIDAIKAVLEDENVAKDTEVGVIDGIFDNTEELKDELNATSVQKFMSNLKQKVAEYYEGN